MRLLRKLPYKVRETTHGQLIVALAPMAPFVKGQQVWEYLRADGAIVLIPGDTPCS